jgi:hypothetical protein
MKKFIKPIIILVLAAVFAALLIIPSSLPAQGGTLLAGVKMEIHGVDTCACPVGGGDCQCLILDPPID